MKLIDKILIYSGISFFVIGIFALYYETQFYIQIQKYTMPKAFMYAFGEAYMIFMIVIFCYIYYKYRQSNDSKKPVSIKNNSK